LESAALNTSCLGTYGIGIRNLTQYRDYIQLTGRVAPPPQYRAVPLRIGRNCAPPPRIDLSTSHPSSLRFGAPDLRLYGSHGSLRVSSLNRRSRRRSSPSPNRASVPLPFPKSGSSCPLLPHRRWWRRLPPPQARAAQHGWRTCGVIGESRAAACMAFSGKAMRLDFLRRGESRAAARSQLSSPPPQCWCAVLHLLLCSLPPAPA
jgi:hypothetical protein